MPPPPHPHDDRNPACTRSAGCCCPRAQRASSDLETLLATPGFAGSVLGDTVTDVTAQLPALNKVVGVTVAGPIIVNDVGVHDVPVLMGGPIRTSPDRITLRLNPSRLGAALVTEPAATMPPTLRLFDTDGNTAHATYLTEDSDRLAFEALSLRPVGSGFDESGADEESGSASIDYTFEQSDLPAPQADQVAQFDAILADGGTARRVILPGHEADGFTRVQARQAIAALEHVALLGMPMTFATAAPGCMQMRHDRLDGAREHRGQMVLAAGGSRLMVNFNLVAECWVTWSQGVWGRTGSIELYDRHGQCTMVATQTGTVSSATFEAWEHLLTDLTD